MPVRVGDGYAKAARVLYDPVDNGLAAHGQQALGQVVGVGAHALALTGDWQKDFHFLLILDNLSQNGGGCTKMGKTWGMRWRENARLES